MADAEFVDKAGRTRVRKTHCKHGHKFEADARWTTNWKGYQCRVCKECDRLRMERKRANPEFRARGAENQRQYRLREGDRYLIKVRAERRKKKEWLDALKVQCSRCPQSHVACLEFHHRDPSQKDFLLSVGVAKYTLARLQAEVDKCEIICSNCHRIHHWEERQDKLSEGD